MKSKKGQYLEFGWPGVHAYQLLPPMVAWQRDFGKFGTPLSKMAMTYEKGTGSFYVLLDEYEKSGQVFFEKVKKNPAVMKPVLGQVTEAAREIFKLGYKWQGADFRKFSNKQLIQYQKELFKWDEQSWQKGQIQNLLEFHNSYLSSYVKNIIGKTSIASKVNEVFQTLTTSTYTSITEHQDRDFLKLLRRNLKSGSLNFEKAVKQHWHKYTWMTYGWAGPGLSLDYFRESIAQARKKKNIAKEIQKRLREKQVLIGKQKGIETKFDVRERQLVLLLRSIMEAKAIRVDAHSMTYFTAERLLGEIGRRVGLSLNQMRVIAPKDVPGFFKKVDVHQINEEYNFVLYWYERGKTVKMTGKKALQKYRYIKAKLPKIKQVNEFKGELAYKGKVRGRVRIILDIKDAGKFKAGEILVTRITDPSYVPLMKEAKAIVTEVGGITSHAAIVSRELRKVCLVGTNIATKVLKDGDYVEVDANKGIVRKVK